MSLSKRPRQYLGVRPINPPNVIYADRAPTSTDVAYVRGDLWEDLTDLAVYMYAGGGSWIALGSGTTGAINTLTGGSGGAIAPLAGTVSVLGTANQLTSTGSAGSHSITFSIPSTFIAPGTIASTTTMTAGSSLTATTTVTATLGAITATNGNFVGSASGTGVLFNSPTATGAAASPLVVNGRVGQAIFTSVSIAAAADLTLTITNSAISGSTTQVIYSMSGATTGSALSIKSVTNSAGSSAIVVTNGTGATTTTSNITLNFIVLN